MRTLRAFYTVGLLGSLTKAADALDTTQSTISRQIVALEREFGVSLVVHGQRPVNLTAAGEAFMKLAQAFFEGAAQLEVLQQPLEDQSVINLVTTPGISARVLPPVISEFKTNYPRCRVRLIAGTQVESLGMIQEGFTDLAITGDPEMPTQYCFEPLFESSMGLVTPLDHPLSQASELTLQAISEYPLVLLKKGTTSRMILEVGFRRAGLLCSPAIEVESFEIVKQFVTSGYGVGIGPLHFGWAQEEHLWTYDLCSYFSKLKTGIVTLAGHTPSPMVASLIEMLRIARPNSRTS